MRLTEIARQGNRFAAADCGSSYAKATEDRARAREYVTALQWLEDAGMIHQIRRVTRPGIRLREQVVEGDDGLEDAFVFRISESVGRDENQVNGLAAGRFADEGFAARAKREVVLLVELVESLAEFHFAEVDAWFSYFADVGGWKLCPELLVNDEDLIRVDTAKEANYARLVAACRVIRRLRFCGRNCHGRQRRSHSSDYRDMVECLQREGVEFMLVGGYAVALHGWPRMTLEKIKEKANG